MKRILLILTVFALFVLGMSFVSAKEDTHFVIDTQSYDYGVTITLVDSHNNPIPNQPFDINITKPNGAVRQLHKKYLNGQGQSQFYLGKNGDYIVSITFNGNNQYNPTHISKLVKISHSGSISIYDYYDGHNYGDSVAMDDYIYDNYWDDEIYDNPYDYDGEWY